MGAIGAVSVYRYPQGMPPRKPTIARTDRRRTKSSRPAKVYPNRIRELAKREGLTYGQIAEAVGAHEITINKLANGTIALTQGWMKKLAPVLGTTPAGVMEAPPTELRRVKVKGALQAGHWSETHEWPHDDQKDAMIPEDAALRRVPLYAAEVHGDSMNLIYPNGSTVIMSQAFGSTDHIPGRRYHVRRTRADGTNEETVKTLVRDEHGRLWLKPESSSPEFQEWIPLDGTPDATVEIIGRVRFAVRRED